MPSGPPPARRASSSEGGRPRAEPASLAMAARHRPGRFRRADQPAASRPRSPQTSPGARPASWRPQARSYRPARRSRAGCPRGRRGRAAGSCRRAARSCRRRGRRRWRSPAASASRLISARRISALLCGRSSGLAGGERRPARRPRSRRPVRGRRGAWPRRARSPRGSCRSRTGRRHGPPSPVRAPRARRAAGGATPSAQPEWQIDGDAGDPEPVERAAARRARAWRDRVACSPRATNAESIA
jgi:hypothetical protein